MVLLLAEPILYPDGNFYDYYLEILLCRDMDIERYNFKENRKRIEFDTFCNAMCQFYSIPRALVEEQYAHKIPNALPSSFDK